MTYANCPRCGLSIRLRTPQLAVEHCPRCLGRDHVPVGTYISADPVPLRRDALAIKLARTEHSVVIVLQGTLDEESAGDLRRELRRHRNAADVVIDLGGVEFIDTAGLRALLSARRQARQAHRRLWLRRPSEAVRRLFTRVGAEDLLASLPTA